MRVMRVMREPLRENSRETSFSSRAAAKANLALQRAAAGITPDRAPAIEALRTAIGPS